LNYDAEAGFTKFSSWNQNLQVCNEAENLALLDFDDKVKLNIVEWAEGETGSVHQLLDKGQRALAHEEQFISYALLCQAASTLSARLPEAVISLVKSCKHNVDELRSLTRLGIFGAYIQDILNKHSELLSFQGVIQESHVKEFNKAHEDLQDLTRQQVVADVSKKDYPDGNVGYRVSEHTEGHLIKHEVKKKTRHIPIRRLLQRAPKAALGLKPCFMMGPRSVAQYLTPGALEFDVLVIDEASQLKPAEALGACARANQMVVVGDSKQLPPTSFFDRVVNDDEDEDRVTMSENESILDAARGANFPNRILRWHYRSRHESLIAFSNQKFYNNELELFPSPFKKSDGYGIQFFYLDEGLYENQQNCIEALAIAERVEHLLLEKPELSLGIATMNRKQSDLVESYIEQRAKDNKGFDQALSENRDSNEPLFVKNLETVQGDERDVIIISCTYGIGKKGSPPQRFGPINGEMGWRRLNVLFTRSRTKMEIFSSMHHGDVKAGENSSRGVHALKEFLHYAETGHLASPKITERPADSDFEISVSDILKRHGFECDFQVGVAGYYIDLAVRHPNNSERHLMGIECDGATYHSEKTARDRDCLRQSVLESLGWKIRRIWSTDWFNHPEQTIKPIIDELKNLVKKPIVSTTEEPWQPTIRSIKEPTEIQKETKE